MTRRLSALERALELVSRDSPVNFAMVARVEGGLNANLLRSALERLAPAHPLAASRLQGRNAETRLVFEGDADFPVRVVDGASNEDWVEETRKELVTPFRRESEPPVRFALLLGDGWTDLVVCCDHAVSDGLSAVILLRGILRLASEPAARVEPAPALPPPLPALAGETLRRRMRLRLRMLRWAAMAMAPVIRPVAGRFLRRKPPRPPESFRLMVWSKDEPSTRQLVAAARREQTTVHAAVCAAFLIAFAERGKSKTRRVSCPVSLRGRIPERFADAFGLYVSIVETAADCRSIRGFWEIARDLKAGLAKAASETRLWLPILAADEALGNRSDSDLDSMARINPKVRYDLSVTNLGRLDFPCPPGGFRLRSLHGPAVNALPDERILGVSTAAGRISFALTFRDHVMDDAAAKTLRDRAMKILARAV